MGTIPPQKVCPKCQTLADYDATQCQRCGHQYRTKFTPPAQPTQQLGGQTVQPTQMSTYPYQPAPPPVHYAPPQVQYAVMLDPRYNVRGWYGKCPHCGSPNVRMVDKFSWVLLAITMLFTLGLASFFWFIVFLSPDKYQCNYCSQEWTKDNGYWKIFAWGFAILLAISIPIGIYEGFQKRNEPVESKPISNVQPVNDFPDPFPGQSFQPKASSPTEPKSFTPPTPSSNSSPSTDSPSVTIDRRPNPADTSSSQSSGSEPQPNNSVGGGFGGPNGGGFGARN